MKKTILTLAALACCVAYAEDPTVSLADALQFGNGSTSITTSNQTINFTFADGTTSASSWYLDLQFDSTNPGSNTDSTFSTGRSDYGASGLNVTCTTSGLSLANRVDAENTNIANDSVLTFSTGDTIRLAYDAATGTATLSNLSSGNAISGSLTSSDTTTLTSGTARFWTNGGRETATLVAAAKSTPATPEPTTATLSLLALAGLAARRRRK